VVGVSRFGGLVVVFDLLLFFLRGWELGIVLLGIWGLNWRICMLNCDVVWCFRGMVVD
jgi:hypothetical protein